MTATEPTTEKPEPGNGESPSKPPKAKTEQGAKDGCTCVACQLNAEFAKQGINGKAFVLDVKPGDPLYDTVRDGIFGKKPTNEQRPPVVTRKLLSQEVKDKAHDLLTSMIQANEVDGGVTKAAKDCLQAAELIYG